MQALKSFIFRHLLNCLHEQEKHSLGISSLSSVPREHRIKRKDLDDDPMSTDADSMSVKPSCSSSALDAISEAPEDEDMISQVYIFCGSKLYTHAHTYTQAYNYTEYASFKNYRLWATLCHTEIFEYLEWGKKSDLAKIVMRISFTHS